MKTFHAALLILIAAAILPTPAITAEQAKPLLTFPKGTSHELRVDGDSPKAMVPVVPDGIPLKCFTFEKHWVSSGARSGGELVEAITVEPEAQSVTAAGDWGLISLTVHADKLRMNGTCNVQIVARAPDPAKPTEPPRSMTFDLTLVLPAARLAPPGTPVWEQVRVLPGWVCPATGRKAVLTEIGGKSRLTNIAVQQVDLVPANDKVTSGKVTFTQPKDIPLGKDGEVVHELSGIFPLGTSRGSARITAAELAEPVPFAFEVRARWHRWLIFGIIAAGLGAGYVIRILLQRRIELNEARLKASDFEARLRDEARAHPDRVYLAALETVLASLQPALRDTKAADIVAALTAAQSDLKKAADDLDARRESAKQRIAEIATVVVDWSLPETLAPVLKVGKKEFDAARAALDRDDVSHALEAIAKTVSSIAITLHAPLKKWQTSLDLLLEQLAAEAAPLPAAIASITRIEVSPLRETLRAATPPSPDADPPKLKAILQAIHAVHGDVRWVAARLQYRLQPLTDQVTAALRSLQMPAADSLAQLTPATTEFGERLAARLEKPESSSEGLDLLLDPLHRAWRTALLAQIPNEASPQTDEVYVVSPGRGA